MINIILQITVFVLFKLDNWKQMFVLIAHFPSADIWEKESNTSWMN